MLYNDDKFGNQLTDIFLEAEVLIQQNQTTIKRGEAFSDNCVHLNNNLKFKFIQSLNYIRSTTFCCQEYEV